MGPQQWVGDRVRVARHVVLYEQALDGLAKERRITEEQCEHKEERPRRCRPAGLQQQQERPSFQLMSQTSGAMPSGAPAADGNRRRPVEAAVAAVAQ